MEDLELPIRKTSMSCGMTLRTPRRRAGNAVELLYRFEPQLFTRYLYEPISVVLPRDVTEVISRPAQSFFTLGVATRSEEHTSELQSRGHLVCRLLLEKKKEKD